MRMPSSEPDTQNYHQKYRNLKRKLKFLIYENECFQDELKKSQRKLLKVSRDKSFLLDRLLRYETVESSSTDSEATVSSDSDSEFRAELMTLKKKRTSVNTENQDTGAGSSTANNVPAEPKKKKARKAPAPVKPANASQPAVSNIKTEPLVVSHHDGHMTSEEIERHLEAKLEAKQAHLRDLIPEKTPLTVPVEMFSNEPVLECDILENRVVTEITPNAVAENVSIMMDIHE
ncbi:transforming growth factor beta regulator 1 [Parasteatoda tepidariorum]|nr:INO80 complex subunit E [Parasteatoda tepidariorum]XP_015908650.2 INO80 complex subunit E [Parasteatoda tepidariorum]